MRAARNVFVATALLLAMSAMAETGVECSNRKGCVGRGSVRACYQCCSECTDAVGCQNTCDRSAKLDLSDRTDRELIAVLESEVSSDAMSDHQADLVEWVWLRGGEAAVRWSLAVASERLVTVPMSKAVRGRMESLLSAGLSDMRSPQLRMTAIACVLEAKVELEKEKVIAVVLDENPEVAARAVELLELIY